MALNTPCKKGEVVGNSERVCVSIAHGDESTLGLYIENLEIDNSLKWVPFNVIGGQITSNALWK